MQKNTTETSSLLRCLLDGHLDEKKAAEILDTSNFALKLWKIELKQTLEKILSSRHVPDKIFLIVDGDKNTASWFAKILKYRFFHEFTISNIEFDVIIITRLMLHSFADAAEGVEPSTNITIKTIFINQN